MPSFVLSYLIYNYRSTTYVRICNSERPRAPFRLNKHLQAVIYCTISCCVVVEPRPHLRLMVILACAFFVLPPQSLRWPAAVLLVPNYSCSMIHMYVQTNTRGVRFSTSLALHRVASQVLGTFHKPHRLLPPRHLFLLLAFRLY